LPTFVQISALQAKIDIFDPVPGQKTPPGTQGKAFALKIDSNLTTESVDQSKTSRQLSGGQIKI